VAKADLANHLGRVATSDDVEELQCGPAINRIPKEGSDMMVDLKEAARARRHFVKMANDILSTKEENESRRQKGG